MSAWSARCLGRPRSRGFSNVALRGERAARCGARSARRPASRRGRWRRARRARRPVYWSRPIPWGSACHARMASRRSRSGEEESAGTARRSMTGTWRAGMGRSIGTRRPGGAAARIRIAADTGSRVSARRGGSRRRSARRRRAGPAWPRAPPPRTRRSARTAVVEDVHGRPARGQHALLQRPLGAAQRARSGSGGRSGPRRPAWRRRASTTRRPRPPSRSASPSPSVSRGRVKRSRSRRSLASSAPHSTGVPGRTLSGVSMPSRRTTAPAADAHLDRVAVAHVRHARRAALAALAGQRAGGVAHGVRRRSAAPTSAAARPKRARRRSRRAHDSTVRAAPGGTRGAQAARPRGAASEPPAAASMAPVPPPDDRSPTALAGFLLGAVGHVRGHLLDAGDPAAAQRGLRGGRRHVRASPCRRSCSASRPARGCGGRCRTAGGGGAR